MNSASKVFLPAIFSHKTQRNSEEQHDPASGVTGNNASIIFFLYVSGGYFNKNIIEDDILSLWMLLYPLLLLVNEVHCF
jgi:hypothetical protein